MSTQKLVVAMAGLAAACFGSEAEVKEVPLEEPASLVIPLAGVAAPAVSAGDEHVTVYLFDSAGVNNLVKAQAQGIASQMFASVGVKIDWHHGSPRASAKGVIVIEFLTNTPTSLVPGALAYTRPYEGVHIQIFWDRIKRAPVLNKVLAHVMVHEITHILEGIDRHSGEGVMKAHWSEADFGAMGVKPLPFAPEDAFLIHIGLTSWNSRTTATAAHPQTTSVAVNTPAARAERTAEQKVTVYLVNDANLPSPVLSRARTLAAEMFAGVGVRIEWRADQRSESQLLREGALAVRLTLDTPAEFKTSVGAFATPSEGVHITVLYEHLVWSLAKPGLASPLLAHVLVHEITHILEGIARHSETGIMKANWTSGDYYDMQTKTLPFASEDIELIHRGLAQRPARAGKVVLEQ